jgi:hypothetical protein
MFRRLPAWQQPFPFRVNMFSHFGFIISFSILATIVSFTPARQLIVIQLDA